MLMNLADTDGHTLPGPEEPDGGWELPLCPGDPLTISGDWTRGRYLAFLVQYDGLHQGIISLRCYTAQGSAPALYIRAGFVPGQPAPFVLDLHYLDLRHGLMPRSPGRLMATCQGRRLTTDEITHIEVELLNSDLEQRCTITRPEVHTSHPPVRIPGRHLVDQMGQLTFRRWPGRTKDEETLSALLQAEAQIENQTWPDTWTAFGGSTEVSFSPTNLFTLKRRDGTWWLVDPDGGGFFSLGINRVYDSQPAALIPGTEPWYAWLPSRENGFHDCRREDTTLGHPTALFSRANLRRAFGDGWRATWERLISNRLRRWRFNSLGVGSALPFAQRKQIPYVRELENLPTTDILLTRDLPDVFDPAFADSAATYAKQLAETRNDPNLIAFILGPAPRWMINPEYLMEEVLQHEPGSHTRRELVHFLQEKYHNDVATWQARWQVELGDFQELEHHCFDAPITQLANARSDLASFTRHLINAYIKTLSAACRLVDPQHLNGGLRFDGLPGRTTYPALAHCDFITIDHHRLLPACDHLDDLTTVTDKPILISSHQAGALDRGLLSPGPIAVASTPDRGTAYRRFVEQAATRPNIIGCHYHDLIDQPGLGNSPGACGNTGLVDVCHTPYEEMITDAITSNEQVYALRQGLTGIFERRVREMTSTAV